VRKKIDDLDLRILDNLALIGPRNVSEVARKLGIPPETLHKRLKRLFTHFYLRLNINVYHTNLGLKKAVIFADATPGYEDLVFDCLRANDFWIYVSRYYGMFEGCLAMYTVPKENCSEFEKFISKLHEFNVVQDVKVFWSTCFQSVQSRLKWFDKEIGSWIFRWDEWLKEIPRESTKLPRTLVDPIDFPILADDLDIFILKELEKDATKDFTQIAKLFGTSQQLVGYHFNKHIIPRGLVESFVVTFKQFDIDVSDVFFFILRFDTDKKLAKFANSLMDKPFAVGLGKVLGQNCLIAYLYLPKREFRNFIEVLSKLARSGFLHSYNYVIQDLKKSVRQTISYEYFKNGRWIYEHEKHIRKLESLIKSAKTERSRLLMKCS
jgi:DNA-binding Lrp family transcriptional regulator